MQRCTLRRSEDLSWSLDLLTCLMLKERSAGLSQPWTSHVSSVAVCLKDAMLRGIVWIVDNRFERNRIIRLPVSIIDGPGSLPGV